MNKFCQQCGAPMDISHEFCPKCGAKVANVNAYQPPPIEQQQQVQVTPEEETVPEMKRPTAVTVACIISWIVLALMFIGSLMIPEEMEMTRSGSKLYARIAVYITLGAVYAFYHIWKMEKVGVYLLAGVAVIDTIINGIVYGELVWADLIVYVILLIVPLIYYKKMN